MRACTSTLIVCLLAVGCASAGQDSTDTEDQGIAELRADAASLQAANVTRVTVEVGGQTQELLFNSVTFTYDAALFLPSGSQTLTARAFSDDTQVGASNPVTVNVQPGLVTRVVLRIIDTTVEVPLFGPLLDSITFPTTIQAGGSATFSVAIAAPANDPVSYLWSSSCLDSDFTSPFTATTSWSKSTPGSCRIDLRATSNGISIETSFTIVVFPEGADNGAVDVSGTFIAAPQLAFFSTGESCSVFSRGTNQSCQKMIASPTVIDFGFTVLGWGLGSPGSLSVSDNCGGRFGVTFRNPDNIQGNWLPPTAGGICVLKVTAVNTDGGIGTLSVAILTRPGTPLISQAPQVFLGLDNGCSNASNFPETPLCGSVGPGAAFGATASANYFDGFAGRLTIEDNCGGGLTEGTANFFIRKWTVSNTPGALCTVTARAANLQGDEVSTSIQFFVQ